MNILFIALVSFAETYIDIKDIPNTKHCKIIVEVDGFQYEKFVKECKLKENQTDIDQWFKNIITK